MIVVVGVGVRLCALSSSVLLVFAFDVDDCACC